METPGSAHPYLLRPFVALAFGLLAVACALPPPTPAVPSSAGPAPTAPAAAPSAPYAVLLRQTQQARGLPGFGANALPAVYGEYQLHIPGYAADLRIAVWATDAPLYFAPDSWPTRRIGTLSLYRRAEADKVLSALPLAGDTPWTVLFAVGADAPAGLTESLLARFFGEALGRFAYFLGTAKVYGDVSLPAIVAF